MRNLYGLGIGTTAAIMAAMGVDTNILLTSATDMPGVKYRHRVVRDKMGFQHSVHERIVPPIKATDADLFGSPKGKRAKRRRKK